MNMDDCLNRSMDDTVREAASLNNVPTQTVGADTLVVDGVRFITLPPDDTVDTCPERENDNSILVRMEFGEFSMLFTGDAETDEREWLMEHHPEMLDVNVLKASHHGSINGADGEVNGESWIEIVDPSAVILTAGEGSPHGHPDPEAMDIYEPAVGVSKVYCTSRMGTIRVYGRPNGRYSIHKQFPFSGSCRF
jgi:beta-lactamase superfamily II metal-dependent hydrolase